MENEGDDDVLLERTDGKENGSDNVETTATKEKVVIEEDNEDCNENLP